MSYEALYRKWRPRVFEDIIGQEQTVTILKNQIKNSNIAHAYLFTGTRGTGKTSTARIFARAVNCIDLRDSNPCNECEICKGILKESIMDVIEIDAASNRGIENIRELRENVKYNPSRGRYKIYIIDEVHMLTKEAFNALLKTLEEPPAHVIFILATTEPQKVPATILSRCQRFDFKPIKIGNIINHLSLICRDLSIDYEEEALRLIALNSDGAVRDALSILEQCVSFSKENLTYEDVANILGAVNYEFIFNLVENIAKENTPEVLTLINKIFMEGKDISQLMRDLISHFRNLLLIKMNVEIDELLVLPEERLKQFREQGKLFTTNQISSFIYTLSDVEAKLKYTSQARTLMEIALVSLCNKELNDSLEGIIERVKQLEKIVVTGGISTSRNNKKTLKNEINKTKGTEPLFTRKKQGIDNKGEEGEIIDTGHLGGNNKQKEDIHQKEDIKLKEDTKSKEEPNDNSKDLNIIKNAWEQILKQMKMDKRAQIEAFLKEGTLEKLEGDLLTITLKEGFEFHRDRLDKEEIKEYIASVITKFTNKNIRLSFIMDKELTMSADTNIQKDPIQKLEEILPGEIFNILEIIDE